MSAKKPAKRPVEEDEPPPYVPDEAVHPGARFATHNSDDPAEVLVAWATTNWATHQVRNAVTYKLPAGGVDERVGIDAEDVEVWKGWKHTCKVGTWSKPAADGALVAIPGAPRTYQKTVRCPHCETDMAYSSSTTVIKHHVRPPSAFPSFGCAKRPPPAPTSRVVTVETNARDVAQVAPLHGINDLAVRLLAILALPFNFFAHPIVKMFLLAYRTMHTQLFTDRTKVREETTTAAACEREVVLKSLAGMSATVTVDGGTIHGRKLFGIGVGAQGRAVFWKLHTVLYQNNLSVSKRLTMTMIQLTMAAVWVVAVVGDNHPGLQMGLRNVSKEYGFLVLRCACHSLQLVVKDLIKQFKDYQEARYVHDHVVQNMTPAIQANLPRHLLKFVETRWSTEHDALSSLFEMRHELSEHFPQLKVDSETGGTVWMGVKRAVDGLQQFKVATKVLEADAATLMDVVCVLVGLMMSLSSGADAVFMTCLVSRIQKNFASPALAIVLFSIPGLLGHLVDLGMGDAAQELVDIVVHSASISIFHRETAAYARKAMPYKKTLAEITSVLRDLTNKWISQSKLPNYGPTSWSAQGLKAFWATLQVAYGWLAEFLVAVISSVPSEAMIERLFSHTKLILDATRTRMAERPTEDQTFLKFNGPRRSEKKPSQENKKEDGIMEELRCVPANWGHLVALVHHVIEGMRIHPVNAGDVEGAEDRWKKYAEPTLEDVDEEDVEKDDGDGDENED